MIDSDKLRRLRVRAGLSREQAARLATMRGARVSASGWYALETGRRRDPRVSTVVAMALALGVLPGDLIAAGLPGPSDACHTPRRRGAA